MTKRPAINCVIKGAGMISSLGVTALQTCTSLKAGITRKTALPELYLCMADDPYFDDRTPLVAATVSFLDSKRKSLREPAEWLALIAGYAFKDLEESSGYRDVSDRETGLFVSLPPSLFDQENGMDNAFVIPFHNRIEKDPFPMESYCFEGHTGVFTLMEQALAALEKGEIRNAIVGGVESCLFPDWLSELDKAYKIKSGRNIDGYIPGEVAAFVWMTLDRHRVRKAESLIFGVDRLNVKRGGVLPAPASALTAVISEALPDSGDGSVIFCDLNGESKRMDEWGYVRTRLG